MVSESTTEGLTPEARRESTSASEHGTELRTVFAEQNEPGQWRRRPVTRTQQRVLAFTWLGIFSMAIYGLFMGDSFLNPNYTLPDRIASLFLIFGLLFILIHGFGYANSMLKAAAGYHELRQRVFSPVTAPRVVCLVACFNEPAQVLEETVAALASLDYPNKHIVILDDSTKEETREATRALALKYGASVKQRTNRRGYKAGAINDFINSPECDADFLAIFDADALPAHNFLRDMVPVIEENPRLAFVQTPQYYANTNVSGVALAAMRQQAVFYEYICEGKSYSRAMFCCGTNVVFRRAALLDVKGFDESSVTEDFATSLRLHMKGYDSTYYNQVYVYSLAPETLSAYFTQQSRWALGSCGMIWRVLGSLIRHPRSMRIGQWWEYYLSSSYYWVGWVNFIFMLLPMMYIFFRIQPLKADVFSYAAIFIPYFLFTMNMFYLGMEERGYRLGDMLLGQQIGFLCFPIHMSAAVSGVLGLKRPFGVTPKGKGGKLGWLGLLPQLIMMVLSGLAFLWGMYLYFSGPERATSAIVINSVWALYHVVLLSGMFRLNRRVVSTESKAHFEREPARAVSADGSQAVPASAAGGAGVFAPGGAARPVGKSAPALRRKSGGRLAFFMSIASVVIIVAGLFTMCHWWFSPGLPINVYIVDRTAGRDYQEHRSLSWTLNFIKAHKSDDLNPSESTHPHSDYRFAEDFYGFIPGSAVNAKDDPDHEGDLLVGGTDRPIPNDLNPKAAVFLADTYGEFVEWDPGQAKFVRYRDPTRGVLPEEVDNIQKFYDKEGLLVAEWNTIGYPTLPGQDFDSGTLKQGILDVKKGLAFIRDVELPKRKADLQKAQASGNKALVTVLEGQVAQSQDALQKQQASLNQLLQQQAQSGNYNAQLDAQRRLEKMLHVHYQGWYGRYVDKFQDEHEFDFRLWKNVNNFVKSRFPSGQPTGPGFVFYRDGPSEVADPQDAHKLQPNPFSEPIVILQDELPDGPTTHLADIHRTDKDGDRDDPLLKDVSPVVPCRFWFDLVQPAAGSKVLANYQLRVKKSAGDRLAGQNFPGQIVPQSDGTDLLIFPAAVAYYDSGAGGADATASSELRSFYFAGDASDYTLVSKVTEAFPSTGGIAYALGHRFGSFPTQYYWNYYEPFVHNIMETPRIQYEK